MRKTHTHLNHIAFQNTIQLASYEKCIISILLEVYEINVL